MVLVKRQIPPVHQLFGDDAGPLDHITGIPDEKILQVTNQANLAGILTQFTLLSQYANEMFTNLLDEAKDTCCRIKSLSTRADNLQKTFNSVESLFQGDMVSLLSQMNNSSREVFSSTDPEQHQLFTVESRPSSISDVYSKSSLPPSLELLDPFTEDGTSCLTKYTHPKFFFEKWYEEQEKKLKEIKEERKRKRAERQAQKGSKTQQATKTVKKMKKVRYDPQTGEKIIEEGEEEFVPVNTKRHTIELDKSIPIDTPEPSSGGKSESPAEGDAKKKPKKKKKDKPSISKDSSSPIPPPLSKDKGSNTDLQPTPESKPTENTPAPDPTPVQNPPPLPPVTGGPPPPPPPVTGVSPPPPPPPTTGGPPPPPPTTTGGPPPPPTTGGPPPPPPPSNGPPMPGKSDLLESIRGGNTKLNPVNTEIKEKPVDTRSNLMECIRAGIRLESASSRQLAEKKPVDSKPLSVAEILARRVAIEPDSDSEIDDDDDDWSD